MFWITIFFNGKKIRAFCLLKINESEFYFCSPREDFQNSLLRNKWNSELKLWWALRNTFIFKIITQYYCTLEIYRLFRIICSIISFFEGWNPVTGITCIYTLMFYFQDSAEFFWSKVVCHRTRGQDFLNFMDQFYTMKKVDVYKMYMVDCITWF